MSKKSIRKSEDGLVAIIVTMLIMVIVSLLVLGFAQLTRREQRQSLDRQLSTQAFYAAETGINDAIRALNNNPSLSNNQYISDCDEFAGVAGLNNQLASANVTYSCLLVDPSPISLEYKVIEQNSSKIIPVHRRDDGIINNVTIQWEDAEHGNSATCAYPSFRDFPSTWSCPTGILRVEFVPFAGSTSRDALIDTRFIGFMQPNFSGGVSSVSFTDGDANDQGVITNVSCSSVSGNDCEVTISGITTTNGYLRITPYYRPAGVTICSPNCSAPSELTGAQAQIDVTGRSVDVLRRVQVRAPIDSFGYSPEFAVQTFDTFCKRLAVASPNTADVITPTSGGFLPGEAALCSPN